MKALAGLLLLLTTSTLCDRPALSLRPSYELAAPSYQYEFSERADKAFNETSQAMKVVALGFAVHTAVQASTVLYVTISQQKPITLLGIGGCIDEAMYAWFIYAASHHFNMVATSEGNDIEHLMTSVQEQTKLWRRMRNPLFVQALLMLLGLVWKAYGLQLNSILRALLMTVQPALHADAVPGKSTWVQRALTAIEQTLAAATPSDGSAAHRMG